MGWNGTINVYIDETGDEGFRKLGHRARGASDASSEWLILSAVMIRSEQDREQIRAVDGLRELLGQQQSRKPLHWRNLRNDHTKKRLAADFLARQPFHVVVAALWKPRIAEHSNALQQRKGYLYNYASRFLIERASYYAEASRRRLSLRFESRATTSYADLESYVRAIEADPRQKIRAECIADVRPVNPSTKGAQLADFFVGMAGDALEPDPHGYTTEEYIQRVRPRLFRRSGRAIWDDGFKLFPARETLATPRYAWIRDL